MNKMNTLPRVIGIVGPTAVGKSALAIELALLLDGEIISCDSMQIYRGMDIGTAKATPSERAIAPHHLIDIKEPSEDFSCADYATLATEALKDILSRGKTPIFCGGTGLYLDSVLEIQSFTSTERDDAFRSEMEALATEKGPEALHSLLMEIDSESAMTIHKNNVKRVIRALEIFHTTGKKKSELDALSRTQPSPYDSVVLFLCYRNKELLYEKINARVDKMIEMGLVEECRSLWERGLLYSGSTASEAIGYKELLPYFEGNATLDACIEELKLATRHYAKRQMTWFKKKSGYHTIYIDEENALERAKEVLKL